MTDESEVDELIGDALGEMEESLEELVEESWDSTIDSWDVDTGSWDFDVDSWDATIDSWDADTDSWDSPVEIRESEMPGIVLPPEPDDELSPMFPIATFIETKDSAFDSSTVKRTVALPIDSEMVSGVLTRIRIEVERYEDEGIELDGLTLGVPQYKALVPYALEVYDMSVEEFLHPQLRPLRVVRGPCVQVHPAEDGNWHVLMEALDDER